MAHRAGNNIEHYTSRSLFHICTRSVVTEGVTLWQLFNALCEIIY